MGWAVAIGGLISAYSSIKQGQYQAGVARNNAQIAKQNAQYEIAAGKQEENAQRIKTGQLIGAARANAAASGIDANSGTPVNIQSDIGQLGELDSLTVRNNALRRAYGYQTQAATFKADAKQASSQGYLDAFGSLLGTGATLNEKWGYFK